MKIQENLNKREKAKDSRSTRHHVWKKGRNGIKEMRGKSFTKQLQQPSAAVAAIIARSAQLRR